MNIGYNDHRADDGDWASQKQIAGIEFAAGLIGGLAIALFIVFLGQRSFELLASQNWGVSLVITVFVGVAILFFTIIVLLRRVQTGVNRLAAELFDFHRSLRVMRIGSIAINAVLFLIWLGIQAWAFTVVHPAFEDYGIYPLLRWSTYMIFAVVTFIPIVITILRDTDWYRKAKAQHRIHPTKKYVRPEFLVTPSVKKVARPDVSRKLAKAHGVAAARTASLSLHEHHDPE